MTPPKITHGIVESDHKEFGTVYAVTMELTLPSAVIHDPEALAAHLAALAKNHPHFKYMRSNLIER